jgi:hypothetical protein
VGTFNFSAKYLSKKDSSTMLPELTEFVPATRMGIESFFDKYFAEKLKVPTII